MIGVGTPVASHWNTAVDPTAMALSSGRSTKCGVTAKTGNIRVKRVMVDKSLTSVQK